MFHHGQVPLLWLVLAALVVGCGPSPRAATGDGRAEAPQPSAQPKKINAAIMGNPPGPYVGAAAGSGGNIRGHLGLEQLVTVGLTIPDDRGALRPQIAEAVPSIENGLWRVLPDGGME